MCTDAPALVFARAINEGASDLSYIFRKAGN